MAIVKTIRIVNGKRKTDKFEVADGHVLAEVVRMEKRNQNTKVIYVNGEKVYG